MQMNKKTYWPLLFLQGILVGTGAILPGISGGVLCVAFGIYEPMMEFLAHPIQSLKKKSMLFLPLFFGGLVGFVLLAKAVNSFLSLSAVFGMALFSGLICGTIPGLMKKSVESGREKGWPVFIIVLVASFVFFNLLESGIEGSIQANFGWYVFCGAIWALSMVVPGLSSSSILIFIGLYQPMAAGIGNLDFKVLLPLAIGFLVTIVIASKIVNRLLKQHYTIMSRIILGFVISSVLMIIPISFADNVQVLIAIACFAVGFLLSHWMDRLKIKQVEE